MRFILLIIFFCVFNVISQQISFVSYSTNEGLPQSQVTAITEDSDGYLWVGTLGGLAKFNGKDFVTYSSESGLLNNRISFLKFIDNDLWIGHQGGVSCYHKSTFKKWSFTGENKTINVRNIIKFNGKIIIATNGGGLFSIDNQKLKAIEIKNESHTHVRDLLVYKNNVFLTTRDGVFKTKDFKKYGKIDSLYDYNSTGIEFIGDNFIITTLENGLYTYDPLKKLTTKIHLENDSLNLKNVFVDSKNNCWINTDLGVLKIDKFFNEKLIDESKGLPVGVISSVFEDLYGNIWFGSLGKGLLRFPGENFVYYNRLSGFSSDLIMCVNQDNKGKLWFGTFDKGIMTLSKNNEKSFQEFPNNRVWASVMDVNGYNWFGTDDGLAQVSQDGKIRIFSFEDNIPGIDITALYKLNANQMYVGGSEGVSIYKNGKFNFLPNKKKQDIGTVRSFAILNKKLICGTSKGLFIYNKHDFEQVPKIQKAVYCIEKDNENNLWIGTEEGLFVYSKKGIVRFKISTNPSSNLINFLNFKKGRMYIGTNNGLYVIEKYQNEHDYSITHFGVDEGIVDIETNINSSFFDNDGNFWFGTSSGVVKYKIDKIHPNFIKPKINLKSILLNYEAFDYSKYSNKLDEKGFPTKMVLPYFKNNITFEIDGVSLSNHSHLKYQFWLEGYDEKWTPESKNSIISFTGLSAGEYVLHARTINGDKLYSEEISIPFEVNPPFYKSWWFILLFISIIVFISFKLFKFRLRREREKSNNEMIEYKSKLLSLEQKSLNASMNRHFIFNSLNSIQYFINSQDRLSANRYLTNFAKLIRKNLDSTTEEGNMITLTQELEGLELYLSLESMRFKDRFDYEINCVGIDAESVIIPAMLLQPFIENSIIHGILPNEDAKGLITINISSDENILSIQIDDNGIGIKNSMIKKQDSKGDHRSQGMEITTKRIDLIKKIFNKGFDIIGPFQINEMDSLINGTRVLLKIPFKNLED